MRLRDVHELLMDTGLGAKAYAIIEQGKIGQILSTRPTDRRQLIEEAAGVTKYKARRRAAELKLEASQQNLTRIDDIVFEVEKQRAALKRQAAKARRYKRLREELRRWEKVLFARRYRVLAAEIESARARLSGRRDAEAAAAARLAAAEDALARTRLELARGRTRRPARRASRPTPASWRSIASRIRSASTSSSSRASARGAARSPRSWRPSRRGASRRRRPSSSGARRPRARPAERDAGVERPRDRERGLRGGLSRPAGARGRRRAEAPGRLSRADARSARSSTPSTTPPPRASASRRSWPGSTPSGRTSASRTRACRPISRPAASSWRPPR